MKKIFIYYAVPIKKGAEIIGVMRVSVPETTVTGFIYKTRLRLSLFGLLVCLISALLLYGVLYYINSMFREIRIGAEKFASGELDFRFHVIYPGEIGSLAGSLNAMASQLSERLDIITLQRNELMAVLTSMTEGVLAVDNEERIIRINSSAARLLDIAYSTAKAQKIQEAVRNVSLYKFIKSTLSSKESFEEVISIQRGEEKFLHLHGTTLFDAEGKRIGALIVINDITRIKRLERIRQDFVSNVSHELKTPITSIKGFVETLRDGAFEDKDTMMKFLGIIEKHADRLNSIVEDILMLSRIEQDEMEKQIETERKDVCEIINNVVLICSIKAAEKEIELTTDCAGDIFINCNSSLMEQALINLVDNSIKYSDPGKRITIRALSDPGNIILEVSDNGWGIPASDIPRIFERFYRVDKARSRALGGTGLGLSIVKHIVQSHNGKISVISEIGTGSTFRIILPIA